MKIIRKLRNNKKVKKQRFWDFYIITVIFIFFEKLKF